MSSLSLVGLNAASYFGTHPSVREVLDRKDELGEFDLIFCQSVEPLPLATRLLGNGSLVVDIDDYPPSHLKPWSKTWFAFQNRKRWLYYKHLNVASSVLVPSPGILRLVNSDFNQIMPQLVINSPLGMPLSPSVTDPRELRLVHHGNCLKSRGIREMLFALIELPDSVSIDFIFNEPAPTWFYRLVRKLNLTPRVTVIPRVAPSELASRINCYDAQIIWTQPDTLNNLHVLPGKYFESMQAGIGVIASPTPDLAEYIGQFGNGVVGSGFGHTNLAKVIRELTPEKLMEYKWNSFRAFSRLSQTDTAEVIPSLIRLLPKVQQ